MPEEERESRMTLIAAVIVLAKCVVAAPFFVPTPTQTTPPDEARTLQPEAGAQPPVDGREP